MDIRQFRAVLRARSFDRTCKFYEEVLALPRIHSGETLDLRVAQFQAGAGVIEVQGRPDGAATAGRDEQFDYQGPEHKLTLTLVVPSAEKAFEEAQFRHRNIPGGLRTEADGTLVFVTRDPDGVLIRFEQAS